MKFIKIGNFYLYSLDLSITSNKTSFMHTITLYDTPSYCNSYTKEHAEFIKEVLVKNGFNEQTITLVDIKRED